MSPKNPLKTRTRTRQRLSYRLLIAAGISTIIVTMVLVIYFQFFRNEVSKAENRSVLTQDSLPSDLKIDQVHLTPADTNLRDGLRYKIAKPLPK